MAPDQLQLEIPLDAHGRQAHHALC